MLFNSIAFAIFFPVVVIGFFLLPQRLRWAWLLGASYYFYGFYAPEYLVLLLISTAVAFFCAIQIDKSPRRGVKRAFLILSLVTDLGLLFAFKYFDFFTQSVQMVLGGSPEMEDSFVSKLFLPIGISFYTFQNLSYVIDVYRGQMKAEQHFGLYALYVAFFTQLVAGPIERAEHLLPQFRHTHFFDCERTCNGLRLMLWGLFKKIMIADQLAPMVDQVYGFPGAIRVDGLDLLLGTYFFAIQIYCDFSGYCDIAIGGAQVMGFQLVDNFRHPYLATNIRDFWRRWHISLMAWLRSYLYIPLGGNRVTKFRWLFNIMIVFVLSGLWHGANWTFIIWGALHGAYVALSDVTANFRSRLIACLRLDRFPRVLMGLRVVIVFNLVCFAWIFFRAQSIGDATIILGKLSRLSLRDFQDLAFETVPMCGALGMVVLAVFISWFQGYSNRREFLREKPLWAQWGACYAMIVLIILFHPGVSHAFIYFQF